ncbi:MAG: hypothetical protein ABI741_02540 [Ferruginibacter sp.]
MRKLLYAILQVLCLSSPGQKSDGFFIQEFCFIDIDLIKQLKVDKFEIAIYQNNSLHGRLEIFLDSNFRMIKKVSYADSITATDYASTSLTQYACPIIKPGYIKECVSGRITKTAYQGAYRMTSFDAQGKVTDDRWKPGAKLLEISRQFIYSNDLIDTIKVEDITTDGRVDKKEIYLYNYQNEKLITIKQLVSYGDSYYVAGKFNFKYYDLGLLQRMKGTGYSGQLKAKVEFKYFSKGQLLKD